MLKSESFSHLEETLKDSQELMTKIIEKNVKWPGGGALDEDIDNATSLLKQAQTVLVQVGETIVRHVSQSMDIYVKPANDMLDQAYHLLNLMYHDTKKIRISLGKGVSQTTAIRDLEIHLKKFTRHCEETQGYLLEAAKIGGELL